MFVLGLYGCTAGPVQRSATVQLKLLPPGDGPAARLLKQKVTLVSEGQEQQFIAVIRLQPERLKLMALLPTGQQLFFLEYDGETLTEKNYSSKDLPIKDMLAIMQFVLWPPSSVNHHYAKTEGWIVNIIPDERTLLNSYDVLLKVNYQTKITIIENRLHGYRLKVEPLES